MSKKKVGWFNTGVIIALALLILALLGVFKNADAGTADLTWTAPTKSCNGTSLTNLTGYSLTYGQKREALPMAPLSKTVMGLTPGVWWFSLAAVTPTERSEFVTVEKTVLPEEFKTTGTTVYTFVRADGKVLILPTLHTVPVGTVCDATQSVSGKYVVPREAVTWSGSARLVAVLADCG